MDTKTKTFSGKRWLFTGIFLLLLVQGLVRFAAVRPAVGLVTDDWAFLADAERQNAAGASFWAGLANPTRPFSSVEETVFWRIFLGHMAPYEMISVIGYSLVLLLLFLTIRELTGKTGPAFAAGLLFAVLPNVGGHFHWLCLSVGQGHLPYLASLWLMARHVQRGERWALWGSVFSYAMGLGSYEVGAFLPVAYAVLLAGKGWKRAIPALAAFGVAFAVYAAWRLTAGFGLGKTSWVAPQFEAGMTWYGLKHTAAGIVSWWCGLNCWRAIGDGATGFSELPMVRAGILLAANVVLLVVSGVCLKNEVACDTGADKNKCRPSFTLAAFGVVWVAAAYLPAFLGYLAPRLNYLPGAGMAFLASLALARIQPCRWMVPMLFLVFAGMVVAEGDTKNWSDSIRFQSNLSDTMAECRADWESAEVFWLDTRELSQRLTPSIVTPPLHHINAVADFRNVPLIRGFGPSAMAELILQGRTGPRVVLDVEYGAHEEDGVLKWHERYDPSKPFETPMDRVYRLDVLAAGTRSSDDGRD